MVESKRVIAAIIVCLKPHVFLTTCIILVIVHSIFVAIQRGVSINWRIDKQHDVTLSMTVLILFVALLWAAFFVFMVRFELRAELNSLLALFQCSKRGLRFLGVLAGHVILLTFVALVISLAVERSMPVNKQNDEKLSMDDGDNYHHVEDQNVNKGGSSQATNHGPKRFNYYHIEPVPGSFDSDYKTVFDAKSRIDRGYLLVIYKIWLTAIVYSFLYLVLENMCMIYADMSLVEFIHEGFLYAVAKLTGIDLSDYPAGEMLFNPLVRRRFATM